MMFGCLRCAQRSTRRSGRSFSLQRRLGRRASICTGGATRSSTGTCHRTLSTSSSARDVSTVSRAMPFGETSPLQHRAEALADPRADVWEALFEAAESRRCPEVGDMQPYWAYPGKSMIERSVLGFPMSRDQPTWERLKDVLVLYRLAYGQPRQEDMRRHGDVGQPDQQSHIRAGSVSNRGSGTRTGLEHRQVAEPLCRRRGPPTKPSPHPQFEVPHCPVAVSRFCAWPFIGRRARRIKRVAGRTASTQVRSVVHPSPRCCLAYVELPLDP